MLEEKPAAGGAAKTEHPFAKAPRLGTSTGAYLLAVMQPEPIAKLGGEVRPYLPGPSLPPADDRPAVPAVRF